MSLTAYDYERQTWVTGRASLPLLIAQAEESLDLLRGPSGDRFHGFQQKAGDTTTKDEAIRGIESRLAEYRAMEAGR